MRVPRLTVYQIVIEILCIVLLIAGIVVTAIAYPALPAQIPNHFDASGAVTDYSSKGFIWLLSGMNFFIYAMMTVFIFIPAVIENPNTTWVMNPAAKGIAAKDTLSLLGETKLECVLMFDYILIPVIRGTPMNTWPIWGLMVLMFVGIFLRMRHMKKYTQLKRPWEK